MAPAAIEQFRHIRRLRDPKFSLEIAAILPGEYFVSPAPMIVYTVLGSCVSVCIRDPISGVGGMNHFMLPFPKDGLPSDSWGESARYGSFAMEVLINALLKQGGKKSRFEVKVFGGGKIYDGSTDVGAGNSTWAMDYIRREGMSLAAYDTGGEHPRKVYYFTDSGRVLLKKIERFKNQTLFEREAQYRERLLRRANESDVTLFEQPSGEADPGNGRGDTGD